MQNAVLLMTRDNICERYYVQENKWHNISMKLSIWFLKAC